MPVFSYLSVRTTFDHMANFFNNITINTKYGAMAVTATPIVIIASVYVAWAYISRAWRKPKIGRVNIKPVLTRSMSVGVLHGGKLALERLVAFHRARADETYLQAAEIELKNLLQEACPDFKKLQHTVAKLEMSGKEAEAVSILEKAFQEAQNQNKQHEAYEIQMMLAEMLIYKGDFKKALLLNCLNEEQISDARRPLYQAIIFVMSENSMEAAVSNWEKFKEMQSNFQWPPGQQDSQLHEIIEHFDEFEKVVNLLKQDIKEAKK